MTKTFQTPLKLKARTVVDITGERIKTIPKGTEFTISFIGPLYSECSGLGITSIWNVEYEPIWEGMKVQVICGDRDIVLHSPIATVYDVQPDGKCKFSYGGDYSVENVSSIAFTMEDVRANNAPNLFISN